MTGLRLTHIGGPTVLVEAAGWRILTDPTFDPPGRRYHFGFGTASTKVAGPAIALDELGLIDAVLLTHDHHADNLDDTGRALLADVPIVVTTTSGATRLGGTVRGLDPWATTTMDGPGRDPIEVTATPCRHGPPLSHPLVGDAIGFALRWDGQTEGVLWFSGDTVLYDDVRRVPERLGIGVAVLHLGGARFGITGPVRYTMTARQGIELCELTGAGTVVPVHYEGWSHFRDGGAIEAELAKAPQTCRDRFRFLPIGEANDLPI